MLSNAVYEALKSLVPESNLLLNEPLSRHTTFKVGGPADCFVEIEDAQQLKKVLGYLKAVGIPFFVMGNGSNILVSDKGVSGVILNLSDKISRIEVSGNTIKAEAGARLTLVSRKACEAGLKGMEFAAGIPGCVGGAVCMNAGAYGGEMKQVIKKVTCMSYDGELLEIDNETMEFGYRTSAVKNRDFIVVEAEFSLEPGNRDEIKALMDDFNKRRRDKQPLEYPSAGSTFKRPEGYFAGELIMKSGLAGERLGGATVSPKHCGLIVNDNKATATDIKTLIDKVKIKVKE
ncbi:MAG: UDP-N-acetylmuramate dehydrogenase, partial [Lachnospiraceae bacterium]|nr:UDP-N-acetylmuramate dehydrogenase [Lachnospiraceae bacterium]